MRRFLPFVALVFSLSVWALSQSDNPLVGDDAEFKNLNSVQVPTDYALDFSLGPAKKSTFPRAVHLEEEKTGDQVFADLLSSPDVRSLGLPYRWQLQVSDSDVINASSSPSGDLSVNRGLARMLADSPGMWAAVISHELVHTVRRHGIRQYLYRENIARQMAYYRYRVQLGDSSANWSIIALRISSGIIDKKLSREMEHEADGRGLLLMARNGYHPDFVFAMHRKMELNSGEQSKFSAFFSDHPRWETRDQRSQKLMEDALRQFNAKWPDVASSPGGKPPVIAFMDAPSAHEDKTGKVAHIVVPITCRNATEPVTFVLTFSQKGEPLQDLGISDERRCAEKGDQTFDISASALQAKDRKIQATILVMDAAKNVIETSNKKFDVKVPKP